MKGICIKTVYVPTSKMEHVKVPALVFCKYKDTCPNYDGGDPARWFKTRDFEKCKYYQKFEKETT